jgi:hypothetical protein
MGSQREKWSKASKKAWETRKKNNSAKLKKEVQQLKDKGMSYRKIAKRLNISATFARRLVPNETIPALSARDEEDEAPKKASSKKLSDAEIELIEHLRETGMVPPEYVVHTDRNMVRMEAKYKEVRRLYQASLAELETLTKKLETFNALEDQNLKRALLRLKKKRPSGKSKSVAVSIASDWHLEERVEPEVVNGLNDFDFAEAKRRIEKYFEQTLYLTDLMRHETRIDMLILALLGDLLSGYIKDELIENNQFSPCEAVIHLVHLIKNGLDFLWEQGNFEEILLPCCFGNHSRTTEKMRHSTAYKNSYEYIVYNYLGLLYQDNPHINFKIAHGYHNYVDVFGRYTIRFHHGHNIRYHGGVGGIAIPTNKAINGWNKSRRPYLDVFGHFHQLKDNGSWICNGSLIGYNPYALSIKADYEPPQQAFFTIEQTKGKTFTAPIFLS